MPINDSIVDLIEGIVGLQNSEGTVVNETFDAAQNLTELELNSVFDLVVGDYVELNSVQYKIHAISGTSIFLPTTAAIGATTFKVLKPFFYAGTYKMIKKALSNKDQKLKLPAVFLFYNIDEERILDETRLIFRRPKLQIAFLDESNIDFDEEAHRPIVDEQREVCEQFLINLKANNYVGEIDNARITEMLNFGVFLNQQGNEKALFDIQATGVLLTVDVPLMRNFVDCQLQNYQPIKCPPGIIKNNDGTFNQFLGAGETYTLPPSASCDPVAVDDQGTITNVPSGGSYTCTVVTPQSGIDYAVPTKPSQITSFRTGDTGYNLQNGAYDYTPPAFPLYRQELDYNAVSPSITLLFNNAFGTKDRFTDENGLQVYGNDYFIDHLTGRGYSYAAFGTNANWNTCVDDAFAFSDALYSDYRILNYHEMDSLIDNENLTEPLDHTPTSGTFWVTLWLGDTDITNTSDKRRYSKNGREDLLTALTGNGSRFYVRNHYY